MSTTGMQIELSMTEKGVKATLKDAQGAIVQTASLIKTQLPDATSEAGKGLAKFKEGLGRSRETMMFFTRSLAELGPTGQLAQTALSGLGGLFMGGGVVGLGLAAAQVGMSLLGDAMGKQAKIAEEAKKKNDEVFKKLVDDANAAARAVQDFNAKARGVDPADAGLAAGAAALSPHIAKARAEMEAKKRSLAGLQAEQDAGRAYMGQQDAIDAAAAEVRIAEKTYEDLLSKQQAFEDQRRQIATSSAIEIENARRAADDQAETERQAKAKERAEKEKAEYERKYQLFYGHLDRLARAKERKDAEADRAEERRAATGQAALDHRARAYERNVELRLKSEKDFLQAIQPVTDSIQEAFGGLVQGTMNLGQALRKVLASAIQTFAQMALKQVMSNAAVAGSGAAASQAATPGVGPALSAAAMAAVMGMVMGLTSMISASRGADIGNYAPVAQLHPHEMVLPAEHANVIRGLADGGGVAGGVTVNVTTFDSQSFRKYLLSNQPALAEAIGKAMRDGRRFG